MALQKLASIAVRPRRTWRIAALIGRGPDGCRLQPQPPILSSGLYQSRTGRGPCTNCGGSSPTTVIAEPTGGSVSSVPSLVDAPDFGFARVTVVGRRAGPPGRRYRVIAARPRRKTPQSRLDDEPAFDETASPAPASGLGSGGTPPPPPRPSGPSSGLQP